MLIVGVVIPLEQGGIAVVRMHPTAVNQPDAVGEVKDVRCLQMPRICEDECTTRSGACIQHALEVVEALGHRGPNPPEVLELDAQLLSAHAEAEDEAGDTALVLVGLHQFDGVSAISKKTPTAGKIAKLP